MYFIYIVTIECMYNVCLTSHLSLLCMHEYIHMQLSTTQSQMFNSLINCNIEYYKFVSKLHALVMYCETYIYYIRQCVRYVYIHGHIYED